MDEIGLLDERLMFLSQDVHVSVFLTNPQTSNIHVIIDVTAY